MKIIFFNIGWMKRYQGIRSEDRIYGSSKYIKAYEYGNEECNYLQFDEKYYGFVQLCGDMNISRIDGCSIKASSTSGVLVVWMAQKPESGGTYIIGWYKNANVYREMQTYTTPIPILNMTDSIYKNQDDVWSSSLYGSFPSYYHTSCNTSDAILLPVEHREFIIPNATQEGIGRGRGQSNIWYADSVDAKKNVVPRVLEYISGYNGKSADIAYSEKDLNKISSYPPPNSSISIELANDALSKGDHYEALQNLNVAYRFDSSYEICHKQALCLIAMGCFSEAYQRYCEHEKKHGSTLLSACHKASMLHATKYTNETRNELKKLLIRTQSPNEIDDCLQRDILTCMAQICACHDDIPEALEYSHELFRLVRNPIIRHEINEWENELKKYYTPDN